MKLKNEKGVNKGRQIIFQYLQIILGTALVAGATSLFLLPNQLSAGGFSGIATITYYLFKIPLRNYGIGT